MKHTQGKWSVGVYNITPNMRTRLERPQSCVCLDDDGKPGMLIALCGDAEDRQSQVDADLMSAAPDLLAACQETLNEMRAWQGELEFADGPFKDVCDQLKAAIAKATGQSVKEPSNA